MFDWVNDTSLWLKDATNIQMKHTVEKKSFPPDIFSNDHKCPNTEFQSEYKKMRIRKNSLFGHFSSSGHFVIPIF